jgi:hypothetical protein
LDAAVGDEPRTGVALDTPHSNGANGARTGGPERRGSSRVLRIALLGALVVMIGLWAYALVYSLTRRDPERLSDGERRTLEQACENAADAMRALPPVEDPPDNARVSARASAETEVFEQMLADARAIRPDRDDAAIALDAWIDDWEALLEARRTYATEVRTDKGADIVVPIDAGSPIFVRMNEYAESKGVARCTTEALGAERVNRIRG